ncbi:DUF2235 domain-containing protein [Tardiphaga sp.]|jgi:uncharacterized protein (DUF2235 family)|uniref:DUF2235 domain-containing protein n=1 Tax=Tardiphaga sp. TaxID=1926292 RepID=UPI0037DA2ED6
MARNIVLLSDGTGNSSAKVWRTNVWRTFEALDLSGSDQVAFYDDGVGTSSFKPWAILGGAFGFGLKRNVIDIYKFACRNYRGDEDNIFGFGFSRGAFTIRVVMGLILHEGLVSADSETELDEKARAAYRAYRRKRYHTVWPFRPEDWLRNLRDWLRPLPYDHDTNRQVARIRFIGVWDTVSAYGMPVDEMTRGISKYIYPLELPDHQLVRARVTRACQALALDEERTTFHPELWDEKVVPPQQFNPETPRAIVDEQLSQVWFAGVHSNVGGGYPDDSLAHIPLLWMITEARHCGLKFKSDYSNPPQPPPPGAVIADPDTFKSVTSKRDKDGRIYNPRQGLGGYYRYGPRKLVQLCNIKYSKREDDEVLIERPKIHESVFRRLSNRAHAYAPIGLPPLYDVVTDDGRILTSDQYGIETAAQARARADAQEHVWNEVWKRRIVYFLTVAATTALVIFPLVSGAQKSDEFTSPIRWVSDILRTLQGFLPGFAKTWIDGYARAPISFVVMVAILVALLLWGTRIAHRSQDLMGAIWRRRPAAPGGLPTNWIYRLRSDSNYIVFHESMKRRIGPSFFALVFVYVGLATLSHIAFNIQDVAGMTCKESPSPRRLMPGQISGPIEFRTSDLCRATGIEVDDNRARYVITVTPGEQWTHFGTPVPVGGFTSVEPPRWYHRILLSLALPLRRALFEDWFRITLRYGRVGGEEAFYVPDLRDDTIQFPIVPTRSGELFVFINDAVIGVPGLYGVLSHWNGGTAQLTIKRTR